MILLGIDILLSYFSLKPTYFFLLNIVLIPKNNYPKLLIITLILDILILNTFPINTLIIFLIFLIYKKLSIIKLNFLNYIISLFIIYNLYILFLGFINHYSILYLITYSLKNILTTFIFYIICYNLIFKSIKLSR